MSETYDPFDHKNRLENIHLSDQHRKDLIRLPYRVGLWVSQSDKTGGDDSDESEMNALETVILSYGEDYCKSEFTQNVMQQTVAEYDHWEQWENNIEQVPEECRRILYLLKDQIDPKEFDAFRETLFEIAETVALAYREIEERETFLNIIYIRFRIIHKKWDAFIKRYPFSLDHALNISPAEEQALGVLKGALS
jgi:hypothetical protein